MFCRASFGLLAILLTYSGSAFSHESRPAYFQVTETSQGRYAVLWRTPVRSGMQLPVVPRFPEGVQTVGDVVTQRLSDSLLERRVIDTGGTGLAGARIEFVGLQATITDVLVRVKHLDGDPITVLVQPRQPWVEIASAQDSFAVFNAYVVHGVDHILEGYDHLLFVLALLLIVRSVRVLVWTITAFTLAHSLTLAAATMGLVHVPGPPVEAAIALSILLLAYEIVRVRRVESRWAVADGKAPETTSVPPLTARWPWVVAFAFGLLHGFGFAGALIDVGLPESDLPLALFAFNVGVELGQLLFIGAVLLTLRIVRAARLPDRVLNVGVIATTYAIGVLAAFWFLQRVAGF